MTAWAVGALGLGPWHTAVRLLQGRLSSLLAHVVVLAAQCRVGGVDSVFKHPCLGSLHISRLSVAPPAACDLHTNLSSTLGVRCLRS